MSVVCHKEGIEPCERDAHYRERVHQRRRARPALTTTRSGSKGWHPTPRSASTSTTDGRHVRDEDNADAHLKRQVMGREVVVAITNGRLDFGPWEQIFYGEFDGRRRKRVLVKIIGE